MENEREVKDLKQSLEKLQHQVADLVQVSKGLETITGGWDGGHLRLIRMTLTGTTRYEVPILIVGPQDPGAGEGGEMMLANPTGTGGVYLDNYNGIFRIHNGVSVGFSLDFTTGVVTIPQMAFVSLSSALQNTWVDFGGGIESPGYMRDSLGFVHLHGGIKSGDITPGAVIVNIPAGYRPAGLEIFPVMVGGDVVGLIDVRSDGNVAVRAITSNTLVMFSGITYRAGA